MAKKTILITGATAGIGEAIARLYHQKLPCRLLLCGRRFDRLEQLKQALAPGSQDIKIVKLDVSDRTDVMHFFETLEPSWRQIDILVNNAGLALGLKPVQEALLDDWEQMIDTNLKGLMYMTRGTVPLMIEYGGGHIVNISSTAGDNAYPNGNMYGATKAAVDQFSRNLYLDLAATPIRVTNIKPGLCGGSEFSKVRHRGNQALADATYANTTPLMPVDVAETVVWATSQPDHVNISTIEVMPKCQTFGGFTIRRDS